MADRVGQRFGNYRLVQLLGQGGFAEVYLGKHVNQETLAAIKVFRTRMAKQDIRAVSSRSAHYCSPATSAYCACTGVRYRRKCPLPGHAVCS